MKTTITLDMFRKAFADMNRANNFSYEALEILFDYLEELEQDTGEEYELDVIAICCDYSEDTFEGIADNYDIDISECEDEEEIREAVEDYLSDNTALVGTTDTTAVYLNF